MWVSIDDESSLREFARGPPLWILLAELGRNPGIGRFGVWLTWGSWTDWWRLNQGVQEWQDRSHEEYDDDERWRGEAQAESIKQAGDEWGNENECGDRADKICDG